MSKSIKYLALVGVVATLAACGGNKEEEYVVVEPEPISVEPTYTGKYK
jgi:outer membrane lipopolysaccharide assembly protein LptE/RlpB